MTKLNTSTGDQTSGKAKWLVLLVLCAAQVGTSGDNAVVGIAASELINGLGASMSDVQLSNAMFSLMTGAFMIAGGLLGLVFGWVRSFRIGICLLIGAEICGAFAPNIETFIFGARVMAGLGASLAIPAVLGIIAGTYNGKDQA
ncbi:MFS transporter, partial [Vibrio lentus]